jgi:hypothetical protein
VGARRQSLPSRPFKASRLMMMVVQGSCQRAPPLRRVCCQALPPQWHHLTASQHPGGHTWPHSGAHPPAA